MKKHLSTIILIAIFFIGLSVLLYPTLANYVNSKHQSRAIAQYVEAMSHVDPEQYDAELAEARAYNEAIRSKPARFSPSEEELEAFHHMLGADNTAIGYIEIPCIRVDLPLYLGTEESVLQVGVGVMPGSSLPIGGESTHSVLSGHRGLPSARLFTDLDKLVVGDTFLINVLDEILTYEVDQILIVEPYDLSSLEIVPGEDLMTLVTCTPYGINTHRLLVRGHRIETAKQAKTIRVPADAVQIDPTLVAPVVAAPMLLLLLLILLLTSKKRPKSR